MKKTISKKILNRYKNMSPQFIVDEKGHKNQVILRLEIFENLLEDLEDLALVAERRDDERTDYASFREELKQEGKL
jgi:hypothetical protein